MWTERQLIYLAGIIDGEGTFYISPKFNNRIVVVNTDERLIRWLRDSIGGLVYSRKSKTHPTWKLKYEWVIPRAQVTILCRAIIPFLVSKKEQAELMLKFRESFIQFRGNGSPVPEDVIKFRTDCHIKMKELNHRVTLPL